MTFARQRYQLAQGLVKLANRLVKTNDTPSHWPSYRAVDSPNEAITGRKWPCAAYSYEGLKSLVEQDGPDGFGATATVAWLISDEGWKEITTEEDVDEVRRAFAIEGIDMDDETGMLSTNKEKD